MTIKRIQWYILLTTILYLILSILGQFIHMQLIHTVYLNELFFLVMALLFLWMHRLHVSPFVRLDVPAVSAFLVATIAVFSTVYISGFLTALSMMLTKVLGLPDLPEQVLLQVSENSLVLVLSLAILPAIAEEFYCRGVVLRSLEKVGSRWQAVLYAGLIFGIFHFHPWNFLSPLFMGIVFGVLAIRYDSVIIAMYSHALFNLIVLISSRALQGSESPPLAGSTLLKMLPMTLVAAFVLATLYKKLGISLMMRVSQTKAPLRSFWPSFLLIILFLAMTTLIYVNMR